ncbi:MULTISPECIES: endolytic transglycosylase MltG [unclassified Actinomyces]|uniref:endolytic transglycosylase MltG n=1 Tax=unclassified Actinomyces TaxID=2609248 RepID=UPI0013A69D07|nr:endolytic transglycosylase MltG [Actinomyces sp. 594]MBW3070218.1 endolytic transglycosylase MltG [Actinomyces sp. 594]NDR52714.1 endolytic transglycosylase MltG [Actinomyces sp. 565]
MTEDDFFSAVGAQAPDAGQPENSRRRRHRRQAERTRRRHRRRRRALTAFVLVVVLAAVGFVGYQAVGVIRGAQPAQTAVTDYTGAGTDDIVVTIPDGATGADIAQILADADVVATAGAFKNAYSANSNSASIQAGTYTLKKHMSAANAVALLLDPSSRSDHTLTIPEGATKAQVKERLMSVGGYSDADVEQAFASGSAIGLPEAAGGDVEGWLAPSTYDIAEDASATDVVASMVSTTLARLSKAGVAEAEYEQVLIKASIVEREVSNPTYYGQVARVIDNRLADTKGETKGMLQMDSTVLYGLGRTGGMPSAEEVADSSNAYNTYQHAGLPPTPIGSPGEAVIQAVVAPPEGDWLYFVTVNLETGETVFATTNAEQEENKKRLNQYCQDHREVCYPETASPSARATATAGGE